ncbi:MAG: hypothetical protein R6U56_06200 [Opitutales bacterium]
MNHLSHKRRGLSLLAAGLAALLSGSLLHAQTEWQSGAPGANASRWGGGPAGQNWVGNTAPDAAGAWARFGNLDGSLNGRNIELSGNRTIGIL